MKTSKVYIHKNPEGMWEVGVIIVLEGDEVYVNKHESSTWEEATDWVQANYIA